MQEHLKVILKKLHLFNIAKRICRIPYYFYRIPIKFQTIIREKGYIDNRFKKIIDYKDLHYGKRCFIVATGPSLQVSDVDKLKNEITFSMNSIIKIFDSTDWRPTYYGIQDDIVYNVLTNDENFKKINGKFIPWYLRDLTKNENNPNFFPGDLLDHVNFPYINYQTYFSDNAYAVVYDGTSIAYSLLQIAVYMGFKEIYLLGCDCDYSGEKQHFADYGVKAGCNASDTIIKSYIYAKSYADSHKIKIYNATRGGKLEVFERVDFDSLFPNYGDKT